MFLYPKSQITAFQNESLNRLEQTCSVSRNHSFERNLVSRLTWDRLTHGYEAHRAAEMAVDRAADLDDRRLEAKKEVN